jgi:hypothetical protein
MRYLAGLVFAAGVAYEMFAPKVWVTDQIQKHEVRTEAQRKEDMNELKELVRELKGDIKDLGNRQYEQAQKK